MAGRPVAVHLTVADTALADVPAGEWHRLAADGSLYGSRAWVMAGEPHPSFEPAHLTARDPSGTLRGLLPAWWYAGSRAARYNYLKLFEFTVPPPARPWPMLVLGSRAGYDSVVLAGDTQSAVTLLRHAHERAAAGAGWSLLYGRDHLAPLLAEALGDRTPPRLLCGADAIVPVPRSGMAGYLEALEPDRARRVRREIGRFEAAGLRVGVDDRTLLPGLAGLLVQNQQRYGDDADPTRARRYLAGQLDSLGPAIVLFTCRCAGAVTGFALAVRHGDSLHVRTVGFDYPRLVSAFEYFNVAFYEPIRWAARHGIKHLHVGMSGYAAKVFRGAGLVPRWAWVHHTDESVRRAWGKHADRWRTRAVDVLFGDLPDSRRGQLRTLLAGQT